MAAGPRRFIAPTYAVGVYFVVVGCGLAVLSYMREPLSGKEYQHGALAGLQLMFLASPFLLFSRFPLRFAVGAMGLAAGLWIFALATLVVIFFPLEAIATMLVHLTEAQRPAFLLAVTVVLQIGLHALIAGAVGAVLDLGVATIALASRSLARALARSALVGLGGASAILIALFPTTPEQWRFAPLTLDVRVTGSLLIVAAFVGFAAHRLAAPTEVPRDLLAGPRTRGWLPTSLIAIEVAWLSLAPQIAPRGFAPSRILIVADAAYSRLVRDGSTEAALADMEQRTGVATGVERILVIYRDPDGSRFASHHLALPDANYLVTIDGTVDETRLHYVQRFQLANSLIQIHNPGMYQPGRVGFAYWAAHHERNTFVTGIQSGESPQSACAELPTADFDGLSDESIPLSSLPFVIAERGSGVQSAQSVFAEVLRAPPTTEAWRRQIADDCAFFMATYAEPPLPELRVEASAGNEALADDGMTERFLAEAKARSGLDARGRAIVVRYAATPPGKYSASEFPGPTSMVLTVSPSLAPHQRRTAIIVQMVSFFISTKYGQADPLQLGYGIWAAQDPDDPFTDLDRSQARARSLCADRAKYPMDGTTIGGVYLASMPFFEAEYAGGVDSGQELLRASLTIGGHPDLEAWRVRVELGCEKVLRTGAL